MRFPIRLRLLAAVLTALILALAGCSGSKSKAPAETSSPNASAAGPRKGGTLVVAMESESDVLDPHRGICWVTHRVIHQIFESLLEEDLSKPSSEVAVPPIRPALAKSYEVSEDGKVYTFKLREGVKFHDGTPFDASAVEFNFRRTRDKTFEYYDPLHAARTTKTFQEIEKFEVVDPMTVRYTMKRPYAPFLRLVTQSNSLQMVSPAAVKKWGNKDFGEHPVGTGPFKMEERVRGQHITLVRNEEYWGQKAYVDKVIYRPIPDASARIVALETGEVDIVTVPPPDSIERLKSKGFQVVMGRVPHMWYLIFNFKNPIMSNVKVRQAIIMAIDREGMARDLLKGTADPAYTIQSPGSPTFDPAFRDYPYDPKKAKELLAEAGYPNGFETIFQTSVDGSGQMLPVPMAEWIQRDLAKIGIKVKLETYEWIAYLQKYFAGAEPNVGFMQQSSGATTPFHIYQKCHTSYTQPTGAGNVGWYSNPEVDKLLDTAMTSVDEKKSNELWIQAATAIQKEAALAPIVHDKAPFALGPKVRGFHVPGEEWYDLNLVWLDK